MDHESHESHKTSEPTTAGSEVWQWKLSEETFIEICVINYVSVIFYNSLNENSIMNMLSAK